MTEEITFRDYQTNALNSIFQYYTSGKRGNPLVVAPTGSGKSYIIAGFCKHVRENWGDQRILIISHVREILTQNKKAIENIMPDEDVGLYAAGLGHKDIRPITLASIQSAYNNMRLFDENFDIILVDEAHLIPHKGEGRYKTMLEGLGKPVVGFTATPFRLGTGYLHLPYLGGKEPAPALFDEIVYNITIGYLIEQGYLCPVAAKGTKEKLNPEGMKKAGGDYITKHLSKKFDRYGVTKNICRELALYKDLRKKWLLFAIDINHAEHIAQELREKYNIDAEAVHSKMTGDRKKVIDRFKSDPDFQCLVSVAVLTTGFDVPEIDFIGLIRPTASPVLHIQIIGRGLRIAPGKENCLILDFAGNLVRNGPIDNPDIRTAKEGGSPIMKECPECFEILFSAIKVCPICGHHFPFKHKLSETSKEASVLSLKEWHEVDQVEYTEYFARSQKWMLKVTYTCGLRTFSEYIAVEYSGYPRHKAEHWWNRRHSKPLPDTVEYTLQITYALREPTRIFVDESGKYPNITKHEF